MTSISGMQNLSISCSLVCLIILGTAALVGFFGLCRHQISAVLITGVMYLLAGKLWLTILFYLKWFQMVEPTTLTCKICHCYFIR